MLVSTVTAEAPYGLLRKVTSVAVVDGQVVAETTQAKLADALESSDLELSLALDPSRITASDAHDGVTIEGRGAGLSDLPAGIVVGIKDYVLVDVDGDKATTYDRLTLNASLLLNYGVDFTLDIASFSVSEMSIALTGSESGTISIQGAGSTGFGKELEVGIMNYPPIVIPVAGFPIVIVAKAVLYVGAEGKVQAKFLTSATESATFRVGFGYIDGGFSPIAEGSAEGSVQPPSLAGTSAEIKGYAGARGDVSVYDVAGAYAGLDGFVHLQAKIGGDVCRTASIGLSGRAGVYADIFGFSIGEWKKSFDVVSNNLGGGPCNVKGGGGDDVRLGWIYLPETGTDSDTSAPVFGADTDGGFVYARSRNVGVHVAKVDTLGSVDWRRIDPGPTAESYQAILKTRDGGYALAGSTAYGPTLTRLSASGKVLWSKQYKSDGTQRIRAVAEAVDGSLFVGGQLYTTNDDFVLLKTNAAGKATWYKRIGGPQNYDIINALLVGSDGYLYAAGNYGVMPGDFPSDPTNTMGWAAKLDLDGKAVWSKVLTSKYAAALAEGPGGKLFVGGYGEGTTPSLHDEAWAVKLNTSNGAIDWAKGFSFSSQARSIAAAADGGAILGGRVDYSSGAPEDSKGFLARFAGNGSVSWTWSYVSPGDESAVDYVSELGNGRIIAGGHRVPEADTVQAWWMSLPSDGRGDGELSGVSIGATSGSQRTTPVSGVDAALTTVSLSVVEEDLGRSLTIENGPAPVIVRAIGN